MKPIHNLRRMALAVLLCTFFAAPACVPPGHPLAWPRVVECGPTVDQLLPTVSAIVLDQGQPGETFTDQAQRELEELARQHGPATVACLVQRVVQQFMAQDTSRMAASPGPDPGRDAAREAAARRGQVWLQAQGVDEVHL